MPSDETILKQVIEKAAKDLQNREMARDEVLTRSRKARQLSKKAILLDHNTKYEIATTILIEVKHLLEEMKPHTTKYPELEYYEEVEAAREEYTEATILHSLLTTGNYPTIEQIATTPIIYLLGLSDVPGELRRETLDALRSEDLPRAENYLKIMEEIHLNLITMEDSTLLKGLRRKLDIMRSVLEATRADITRDTGLTRLSNLINKQ